MGKRSSGESNRHTAIVLKILSRVCADGNSVTVLAVGTRVDTHGNRAPGISALVGLACIRANRNRLECLSSVARQGSDGNRRRSLASSSLGVLPCLESERNRKSALTRLASKRACCKRVPKRLALCIKTRRATQRNRARALHVLPRLGSNCHCVGTLRRTTSLESYRNRLGALRICAGQRAYCDRIGTLRIGSRAVTNRNTASSLRRLSSFETNRYAVCALI